MVVHRSDRNCGLTRCEVGQDSSGGTGPRMGRIDLSRAERPTRARVGGTDQDRAARFRARFPPAAKRSLFIRNEILCPNRTPPVNPDRTEITDVEATTAEIKKMVLDMGADVVGVAEYDRRFAFTQAGEPSDKYVVVFGIAMSYDTMADIGPRSQDEVHRVYHKLDDIGVRLAHQLAAYGYSASMQANEGDIPLPALGYLAGLGELGKHGSLISPELGSSFRLGAVTTKMPLRPDGPRDYGIDEVCASCSVCTRFCPGDAIKPDEKGGQRYRALACRQAGPRAVLPSAVWLQDLPDGMSTEQPRHLPGGVQARIEGAGAGEGCRGHARAARSADGHAL